MSAPQAFVSYDVDHDGELYERLRAEATSCGFTVSGGSERNTASETWRERVRRNIRTADQVIVLCGEHTEASIPMSAELRIAQEERTPYILIWGRREVMCTKPVGAKAAEGMYSWTRQILRDQVAFALRRTRTDAVPGSGRGAARKG